jgi:hypothetical protein
MEYLCQSTKTSIHAVTICVNKHKTTLLDGTLSCWSVEADKTLSNKVIKFIHSLQISLRTKCFSCGENLHINKKSWTKRGSSLLGVSYYGGKSM